MLQYHKDARDTEDILKKLEVELSQKYNPEFKDMYQIEGLISILGVSPPLHPLDRNTYL